MAFTKKRQCVPKKSERGGQMKKLKETNGKRREEEGKARVGGQWRAEHLGRQNRML